MSVRGVDVKVGDKLRYLGGDEADFGTLEVGMSYPVKYIDKGGEYGIVVGDSHFDIWFVSKDGYNTDCFELVEEEKEGEKSTLDLIANLAQEVAKLKRELSELRRDVQAQAYEDNERIERILDDIVMLDERTQGEKPAQKLLSKEVYIYDTE